MGTDHNTPTPDALFAPLQEAALIAYARTLSKGKAPRSPRALVHLAWLALLAWLGLGHLITEAHRAAAVAAACPPGRKPKDDPQTSLLDVVTWSEDGRPGVFVSFVRLKIGNVRETCGQYVLDLQGCFSPSTATAKAVAAGWGVMPETHGNSEGLRFLPPSVVALYLAGHAAALARNPPSKLVEFVDPRSVETENNSAMRHRLALQDIADGTRDRFDRDSDVVDDESLCSPECDKDHSMPDPNDPTTECQPRELTEHDGYTPDGYAFEPDPDVAPSSAHTAEIEDGEYELARSLEFVGPHDPTSDGADGEYREKRSGAPMPVCPRCLDITPGEPTGDPSAPHPGPFSENLCHACHETEDVPEYVERVRGNIIAREAAELRQRIADLSIGDAVRFTSGPHTGRIAHVFEVSADKPKAQLVGRAVEIVDAIDVPADAVEVVGQDPDEPSLRPSALTKKKTNPKTNPSGIEGKARSKDGKRRAT